MSRIGFSYFPRLIIDPITKHQVDEVFIPYIPIRLSIAHNNPTRLIDALIDSGSDRNLFPLSLGEMLGINFKKAIQKIICGIGDCQITAFTAKINIYVNNTKYVTEADFSPQQETLLLGRQGFFNLFKTVTFDENEKFTYLETGG